MPVTLRPVPSRRVSARRTSLLTITALATALVTAALVPGWAAAGPAAPNAVAALAAMNALPPTPNTAWGIDPSTGRLTVTVAKGAPAAGVARLMALAGRFGDVVRIERTGKALVEQDLLGPAAPDGELLGGDGISDGKIVCSVGFDVERDGRPYVLTAGHCTAGLPTWQGVGRSVVSEFPGSDYGLVAADEALTRGAVDLYDGTTQPVDAVGTATVGEQVCASGQATELTCGKVLAVDQTVDYGDGDVVHGLIRTDVHTDHGDSGGPLFDGSTGLGTVSGGDGDIDYFQPLAPAMRAYDLELTEP